MYDRTLESPKLTLAQKTLLLIAHPRVLVTFPFSSFFVLVSMRDSIARSFHCLKDFILEYTSFINRDKALNVRQTVDPNLNSMGKPLFPFFYPHFVLPLFLVHFRLTFLSLGWFHCLPSSNSFYMQLNNYSIDGWLIFTVNHFDFCPCNFFLSLQSVGTNLLHCTKLYRPHV